MATILLVDDDVDLIEMNRMVLARRGHRVQEAYSAAEARSVLQQAAPDAAVIDVMMETESAGFDLCREIHQKLPKLPMLLLTGVHQARELPFKFQPDETWLPVVKVLEKPLPPATLAAEVEALLHRAKAESTK